MKQIIASVFLLTYNLLSLKITFFIHTHIKIGRLYHIAAIIKIGGLYHIAAIDDRKLVGKYYETIYSFGVF